MLFYKQSQIVHYSNLLKKVLKLGKTYKDFTDLNTHGLHLLTINETQGLSENIYFISYVSDKYSVPESTLNK